MSNIVNDQIIEQIMEEVDQLSMYQVVNEFLGRPEDYSAVAPAGDSWDEFFAHSKWNDERWRIELSVKRFEELCR
tara:strand:- start:1067 stop:1291 length:225 start_codon:yes stop_codon:yes gene_type:complete